jgi:hypothetical protein
MVKGDRQPVWVRMTGNVAEHLPDGAGLTPQLLDFIQDWVVCHMQTENLQLARHLRGGGH